MHNFNQRHRSMKNILQQLKTRSDPTFHQTQTPYSLLYRVGELEDLEDPMDPSYTLHSDSIVMQISLSQCIRHHQLWWSREMKTLQVPK